MINTKYLNNLEKSLSKQKNIFKRQPALTQSYCKFHDNEKPKLTHRKFMSLSDAKKYGYKDTLDENNENENILGKSSNKVMVLPKFNDPFVRCLLYRSSGFDIDNILRPRIYKGSSKLSARLMKSSQILEAHKRVIKKAKQKFVSPPELKTREPEIFDVISNDRN